MTRFHKIVFILAPFLLALEIGVVAEETTASEDPAVLPFEYNLLPGWNLVSLPLVPLDASGRSLFPDLISAFSFGGGYFAVSELSPCKAYWVNLAEGGSYTVEGSANVSSCSETMNSGWHLFGASRGITSVAEIVQDPPGILTSVFGFANGYYQAETVNEGVGYWVNLSADGMIFLGANAPPVANAAPVAVDQSLAMDQNTTLEILLEGYDPDGDLLTFSLVQEAVHGTSVLSDNTVFYTPSEGFSGNDNLIFSVSDGELTSLAGTVFITVNPTNAAPVAVDQSLAMDQNTTLEILLEGYDPDGDLLTFSLVQEAVHGTSVLSDNTVFYTPSEGFSGNDNLIFSVSDGELTSLTGTVFITVNPINEVSDFNAPQTLAEILVASRSVEWTSYQKTYSNLSRLSLGIYGTQDLLIIDDRNQTAGATLTVNQNMTASNTHSNDDLLKATFKLIELGIETYLIISSKHSNYAIDFETIAGVKTLLLRDYRSYFVDKSSAGFITFEISRADMATYIRASERYSYDETAGGYIADSSWEPMNVAIEGSSAILTSETGTAFTMFAAYEPVLDQNIPFDFNPTLLGRVDNAELQPSWDGSDRLAANLKDLRDSYQDQIETMGLDSETTIAANAMLENIESTLRAEGASLRYPATFYKTVRENMLIRKVEVADGYNTLIGMNTIPYVYFTNETDSNGIHHPFMVIATYGVNEGMTHLWDIPRPPGDGLSGNYEDQSVTRNVTLGGNLVKIPLKDYGIIDELEENLMVHDLASDFIQNPEFNYLNYASLSATGIALDGVMVYPTLNNTLGIAAGAGEISNIGIHSGRGLEPHYHADAHSATNSGFNLYNESDYEGFSHPPIISLGFDGIAGYGKYRDGDINSEGVNEVLDGWGGHRHGVFGYHYHSETANVNERGVSYTAHILPPKGAWRGRINDIPNFWDGSKPAYGGRPDEFHGVDTPPQP